MQQGGSGVRSLKFWFRLHSCFGWIYSDSETFLCFALRVLLKFRIECYKLFKICSKNDSGSTKAPSFREKSTPVPLLFWKFVKTPTGVNSYTPAIVHNCKVSEYMLIRNERDHILLTPTRDDRIVDFYYSILSCFWKMITVSDPNPV